MIIIWSYNILYLTDDEINILSCYKKTHKMQKTINSKNNINNRDEYQALHLTFHLATTRSGISSSGY